MNLRQCTGDRTRARDFSSQVRVGRLRSGEPPELQGWRARMYKLLVVCLGRASRFCPQAALRTNHALPHLQAFDSVGIETQDFSARLLHTLPHELAATHRGQNERTSIYEYVPDIYVLPNRPNTSGG